MLYMFKNMLEKCRVIRYVKGGSVRNIFLVLIALGFLSIIETIIKQCAQ